MDDILEEEPRRLVSSDGRATIVSSTAVQSPDTEYNSTVVQSPDKGHYDYNQHYDKFRRKKLPQAPLRKVGVS